MDIAWYGVLSGSILSFLIIYATRLGASGQQVGLINAAPALVTLVFALPVSVWLNRHSIRSGVFWSALIFSLFYLLLIPLPLLMADAAQIWAIVAITLVMNIPGTGLAVGFQALFAESVPDEWRGQVASIRNAVVALTSTVTALACGYILTHSPFYTGYQIVFAVGTFGALASTVHVGLIRPTEQPQTVLDLDLQPVQVVPAQRRSRGFQINAFQNFRLDILRGPFLVTFVLLFSFHLAQYLAIPVFPLYNVNVLNLTDQELSIGSSLFNIATFIISLRLAGIIHRYGNKRVLGYGILALAGFPLILSFARGVGLYLLANVVGGSAWALIGTVLYNYLLEKVPAGERPAYLAWYTLALNAAILLGSLIGPTLTGQIGLAAGLLLFAFLRALAGLAILRWG